MLQLPVLKCLKDPDNVFFMILDYLGKLSAKFGRSVTPKIMLNELCGLAMKQVCPTRWWTEWMMNERIMQIYSVDPEAINKVITSCGWKKDNDPLRLLKKVDFELISYYVEFFKLMKIKSDEMEAEDTPTLHLVLSSVKLIQRSITKWTDHPVIATFAQNFAREFNSYFDVIMNPTNPSYFKIFAVAAYLSPFHQVSLTQDERQLAKDFISEEVRGMEGGGIARAESDAADGDAGPVETGGDSNIPGIHKFQVMSYTNLIFVF